MHYITNQTNQVIAADDSLLELLHVESIEELSKQIILDNIQFTQLTQNSIEIISDNQTLSFNSQTSVLSSLVGNLNLISLEKSVADASTEESDLLSIIDDKPLEKTTLLEEEPKEESTEQSVPELDDELIFIREEETPTTFISPEEPDVSPDITIDLLDIPGTLVKENDTLKTETSEDALFELTIPQVPEETIDEISYAETEELTPQKETPSRDTSPIVINIDEVSQNIGISTDDYKIFLNEYIDTAIALEDDLRSDDVEKRSSAVGTLSQLSEVLQLPQVNTIMTEVSLGSSETKDETIESFYAILSRLVTSQTPTVQEEPISEKVEFEIKTPRMEEAELNIETPTVEEPELTLEVPSTPEIQGFGSIDLSDVQAIHFDFQLEEAANDLSLPVELIEEFVHDFIEQAHIETKKMLTAYEKGDLDAIQKIGHMLKGASSNLRINALSDTLYEIQFCEDSSKLKDFIKQYWGHFLSFEQQINVLSK